MRREPAREGRLVSPRRRPPAELLREGIAALAVPAADRVTLTLETYLAELSRWNARFGFVKADEEELVVKHVLDSLSAWRAVEELAAEEAGAAPAGAAPAGGVLDVGTGAGFPGIPLAIALPGVSFTLLERSSRKVAFLKTCGIILGLSNAHTLQADLGAAEGRWKVVTFRAFAPIERFLADCGPGLSFGALLAYKGRHTRGREEAAAAGRPGGRYRAEVREVTVPFMDEERCLVIVRPRAPDPPAVRPPSTGPLPGA
jgi:16S rRNA (guanine527-N7)-methyltransferase